jgi:hypothetical protein
MRTTTLGLNHFEMTHHPIATEKFRDLVQSGMIPAVM